MWQGATVVKPILDQGICHCDAAAPLATRKATANRLSPRGVIFSIESDGVVGAARLLALGWVQNGIFPRNVMK